MGPSVFIRRLLVFVPLQCEPKGFSFVVCREASIQKTTPKLKILLSHVSVCVCAVWLRRVLFVILLLENGSGGGGLLSEILTESSSAVGIASEVVVGIKVGDKTGRASVSISWSVMKGGHARSQKL